MRKIVCLIDFVGLCFLQVKYLSTNIFSYLPKQIMREYSRCKGYMAPYVFLDSLLSRHFFVELIHMCLTSLVNDSLLLNFLWLVAL